MKKRQDTIQMSNMVTGADFGRELRRVIMIVINTIMIMTDINADQADHLKTGLSQASAFSCSVFSQRSTYIYLISSS